MTVVSRRIKLWTRVGFTRVRPGYTSRPSVNCTSRENNNNCKGLVGSAPKVAHVADTFWGQIRAAHIAARASQARMYILKRMAAPLVTVAIVALSPSWGRPPRG